MYNIHATQLCNKFTNIIHGSYFRHVFFAMKHSDIDVKLMWFVFFMTLIVLFYLTFYYLDNYKETLRFLKTTNYGIVI